MALGVSCIDLAVPMVIVRAKDMGKTAAEAPEALDGDPEFKARLQRIWVEAGLKMGLTGKGGVPMTEAELAASETIPKICIVAPPPSDDERAKGANIRVRYFTPQAGHKSLAVTGGACLAACCLIPGTVGHGIVEGLDGLGPDEADHIVRMGKSGRIAEGDHHGIYPRWRQSKCQVPPMNAARKFLLRGHTPIYNASLGLIAAYAEMAKAA